MGNSLVVLLSYLDNILWLCTRIVYGIFFIFEFNYRLVTAIFQGFVELWNILIQGLVFTGNAVVSTIEFLAELPVRSFHLARYLLGLGSNLLHDGILIVMSWSLANFTSCMKFISDTTVNMSIACFDFWKYLIESSLSAFSHFTAILNALINDSLEYVMELKVNTGLALQSATQSIHSSVLNAINSVIESVITGVNYPITVCKDFVNDIISYCGKLAQGFLLQLQSSMVYISGGLDDILLMLSDIASYPVSIFHQLANTFDALMDGVFEGCTFLTDFVFKNWYAMIALGLCFSLIVSMTIYLNVQHDRTLLSSLLDLTRLITSFTSRQQNERQHARHEDHQQVIPPHQQGDPPIVPDPPIMVGPVEHANEINHNQAAQDGGGNNLHSRRNRRNYHGTYLLRSRPFSPEGESSSESSSVENIVSKLKHKLNVEQEKQLCVVCQDSLKNTLFLPCRHLCVCGDCAETIVNSEAAVQRQCPLCRCRIGSIVEVYN